MSTEQKLRFWDKTNKRFNTTMFLDSRGNVWKDSDKFGVEMNGKVKIVPAQNIIVQRGTGLKDKNGIEVFEGDIIGPWTEVDGEKVQSNLQVFWSPKLGGWYLDTSYGQNKDSAELLSMELADFDYEILGNIFKQ